MHALGAVDVEHNARIFRSRVEGQLDQLAAVQSNPGTGNALLNSDLVHFSASAGY